ncbi:hypothetical protein [Agromyces seonyuensis]|uniref:Uncharacterized protein n=1 Tax=Agromyces seonyuensis TaxID=2662446 RepID=A0A6I4P2A8_9MICO|nr:hypothetical protein [Agromyces seonyuensis]MWB97407.1 hypothetical protein [Agromyces seonyuensis]
MNGTRTAHVPRAPLRDRRAVAEVEREAQGAENAGSISITEIEAIEHLTTAQFDLMVARAFAPGPVGRLETRSFGDRLLAALERLATGMLLPGSASLALAAGAPLGPMYPFMWGYGQWHDPRD